MKLCSKCKVVFSLDSFRKDKRNKDGLQSHCKACQKNYDSLYRQKSGINTFHSGKARTKQKLFTEFDRFVITEAEHLRKLRESATGYKWNVDHIVPLNSNTVCGLHNAFNIQVIPQKENLAKGNKLCQTYLTSST
jgi:hypothetical protein